MWFWYSLAALLCWSGSDLFSKIGCRESGDKTAYLKMVMAVGVVMGLHACYEIFVNGVEINLSIILTYLPVSLLYIVSMAIGYIGLGYLDKSVKGLTVSKVAASAKTALDGEWPIARELYIFTDGEPKGGVKKLVDYLLAADKGQKDVLAVGYVPLQH